LVYYDGGPDSVIALRQACEMARPNTRITAIFFDSDTADPMLANAALAAARVNARVYGKEIETLRMRSAAKSATLAALAAERTNVTLFIGMDGDAAQPDRLAQDLIAHAPCRVVVVGRTGLENGMMEQ
jgi:hypothetical protein